MIATIKADLFRYEGAVSMLLFAKYILHIPGFQYTFYMRICNYLWKKQGLAILLFFPFRCILRHYSVKYGFQIPYQTEIGRGLYIGHFGATVINPKAIIGENVNIAQGVTIGQATRGKREGFPIIGNRVWIGTSAIIVGKVHIGDGALIAPNAYVNFDVPENAVVIGNPGQIVSYAGTEKYVDHVFDSSTDSMNDK